MRFLALLCPLLLLVAGCGSSGRQVVVTPRPSTSLSWVVAGLSDLPTLDPALVTDPTSMSVASLVYGGLVRFDARLRVRPDAATRWTISRDGKTYTFYLRRGLRFASGRQVTASDIVTSLDHAIAGDVSSTTASYLSLVARGKRGVPRIEATARRTVRITLARPSAHFLAELAFPVTFVPDPALRPLYGAAWTDHAAGFGPYMVSEWRHGTYLRLVRNPRYAGARPAIRRITIRFADERSALADYRRGTADLVSGLGPGEPSPGRMKGLRRVRLLAQDYLAFNTARKPFRRNAVRHAFAAIWSPAFVTRTMGAAAYPSRGLLPQAFGLPVPPWKPAMSPARYLAAGGYPSGKRFPAVTLILPRDPALREMGLALRRSWQRFLGVDVAVRELNLSNYVRVLDARAFDLAIVRWGADYPDPQDFLGTQLGRSSNNVTGWSSKQYDSLVPLADSYNPRDARRAALFREAAAVATDKTPILPLDEPAQVVLVHPGLRGVALTSLGTVAVDPAALRFIR